mmetsp:Transcript_150445/g.419172  ORF Transcript_150445/g.419172 Transcript_150445/m.419172 type:complete len:356 (+) Transcript_150445:83-1150(+)
MHRHGMPKFAACLAKCATLLHGGLAITLPVAQEQVGAVPPKVHMQFATHATELTGGRLSVVDPVLAVKHVSKTGGSFLINLVNEMTAAFPKEGTRLNFPVYFEEYPHFGDGFRERRQDLFVIASVRNPCDWYVSQWAFASRYDRRDLQLDYNVDFFGSIHNRTKFAMWLQWAMGMPGAESADAWARATPGPHFGVMSLRFWESFVAARSDFPESPGVPGYDTTRLNAFTAHYDGWQRIEAGLSAFKPKAAADCWVRDESYMEDLRFCLRAYEARSGTRLDWEPFEREMWAEEGDGAAGTLDRNKSEHDECEAYYTPELKAAVQAADRHLFRAFGYGQCCGAANAELPPLAAARRA